ncbi:hypothetical protein JTB14_008117 [Gonioctena quinquepunctata]|nr:hypothetical protein JTB14_008117 [Gonioctena quinquepunctata]
MNLLGAVPEVEDESNIFTLLRVHCETKETRTCGNESQYSESDISSAPKNEENEFAVPLTPVRNTEKRMKRRSRIEARTEDGTIIHGKKRLAAKTAQWEGNQKKKINKEEMEVHPIEEDKANASEPSTPSKASRYEEIFERDKKAYEKEKEIGKIQKKKRETEEKQGKNRKTSDNDTNQSNAGKGKSILKAKSVAQNKAKAGPSRVDKTPIKKAQEEESDFDNDIKIRRTINMEKYRSKFNRILGLRLWIEKSLQKIKVSRQEKSKIPFSVIKKANYEAIHEYWTDQITRKYQPEMDLFRSQIRILKDAPFSTGRKAKENFPALQPGKPTDKQKPNPTKGKGKPVDRLSIETSNELSPLSVDDTSAADT